MEAHGRALEEIPGEGAHGAGGVVAADAERRPVVEVDEVEASGGVEDGVAAEDLQAQRFRRGEGFLLETA